MKNSIKGLFIFVSGIAIGTAISGIYFKKKYEKISNEEINSMRDDLRYMMKVNEHNSQVLEEAQEEFEKNKAEFEEAKKKAKNIISNNSYYSDEEENDDDDDEDNEYYIYEEESEEEEEKPKNMARRPYIITPSQFGEIINYDTITVKWFKDHILTDDCDEMIDDPDDCIGWESLNHFGEFEDDCVYVRNDRLKADYEILREPGTYEELLKERPYLRR